MNASDWLNKCASTDLKGVQRGEGRGERGEGRGERGEGRREERRGKGERELQMTAVPLLRHRNTVTSYISRT